MKRKRVRTLCLTAMLVLSLAAMMAAVGSRSPDNPTLTEKRFQASQLAAFFAVDADLARQWVPSAFPLALDPQGKATGVLAVMHYPDYCLLLTPNTPPLVEGENVAPASVVHFWFVLQGPAEIVPVPGAQVTTPTAYYYDAADLVTFYVCPGHSGHDYGTIEKQGFRKLVVAESGEVQVVDNPRWRAQVNLPSLIW